MSQAKQGTLNGSSYAPQQNPPLNGAYYGPAIPPQQAYRGRRSCGCCLLSTLLKIAIFIIVVLGITALVLWLVFRPTDLKVHVENASLTRFELVNGTTLRYNLAVEMSVRNPNRRIGVYYDRIEARAFYEGERFAWVPLPTFYQGHKNTTMLYPTFDGQSFIPLGNSDVADYGRALTRGNFEVDVKIYARIRYKVGSIKTRRNGIDFECELRIPLSNATSIAGGFSRTKCDVDY